MQDYFFVILVYDIKIMIKMFICVKVVDVKNFLRYSWTNFLYEINKKKGNKTSL